MKIKLKNAHLLPAIEFMQGLKLKGEKSRARSKFIKLIVSANTEFSESELELAKDYAVCGNDGNPVIGEKGELSFNNPQSTVDFLKERKKLQDEISVIDGNTYTAHFEQLKSILNELDDELSGETAEIYDILYDAFEAVENDD